MGKYGKKNHVSLNPADVSIIFLGQPKIGKTTIMKEIAEKLVGEDYMFFEMFREVGERYIEGIISEPIEDWEKFEDVVSDIEENKSTDYKDLKMIIIDTWDNAVLLAEKETIRRYNRDNPDNKKKTINEVYGGFQRGQKKAADLLNEMLDRLKNVGIKVNIIMHVKNKSIVDIASEKEYQQLTADAAQSYFNAIKMNYDVIAVAYIDREIVTQSTGRKDIKGKDITINSVKDEVRKIKFRDTGYAIDAGGRLKYITEEVPFEADAFIDAVKDALQKEIETNGISVENRKKEDKKREKDAEKIALANSEKAKKARIDEELKVKNETYIDIVKAKYPNASDKVKTEVKATMKEYGFKSFNDENIPTEALEKIVNLFEE